MGARYLPLTGCSDNQIPRFSDDMGKWTCSPDQVGVTDLTNYYTKSELNTNLATATGALVNYITSKNYISGDQVSLYETDPIFLAWSGTNPLSSFVTNTALTSRLSSYATTSLLNNYATTASLSNYVTRIATTDWQYITGAQVASYETDPKV